jgi:hypothetical protein
MSHGNAVIRNSQFLLNSDANEGGSLNSFGGNALLIDNCTFQDNSARKAERISLFAER